MSNILLSILIERPGATARGKAGRERKRAREWRVHGIWFCFHFVLIWLLSCKLPQPSGYFPFTWALFQLLPCTHPACFGFLLLWLMQGRRQGAKRGLISCQYCPPCSLTRPRVLILCINKALKRPGPPLYWAVQILQEPSCPAELAGKVLQESIVEYSCTKTGNTRKQTYR